MSMCRSWHEVIAAFFPATLILFRPHCTFGNEIPFAGFDQAPVFRLRLFPSRRFREGVSGCVHALSDGLRDAVVVLSSHSESCLQASLHFAHFGQIEQRTKSLSAAETTKQSLCGEL